MNREDVTKLDGIRRRLTTGYTVHIEKLRWVCFLICYNKSAPRCGFRYRRQSTTG